MKRSIFPSSPTAAWDASGHWLVVGLATGSYEAEAEMPGFESVVYDLTTTKNQPALHNFSLHAGAVSETVEVVARSAGVQTGPHR